jgi:hypothetical protein
MLTQPDDEYSVKLFRNIDGNGYRPNQLTRASPEKHEQVFCDNGDGSLFSISISGPCDNDEYRVRHG